MLRDNNKMESLKIKWQRQQELEEQRKEDGFICADCGKWGKGLPMDFETEDRPYIVAECYDCLGKYSEW